MDGDSTENNSTESSSQADILLDDAVKYWNKCNQALEFSRGHSGEAWDALYLIGLSIAGLELVPFQTGITPDHMWIRAPVPEASSWEPSWLVPSDYFNKIQT